MTLLRNDMNEISSFHVGIFLMCQFNESHDCLLYFSKAISYFRPPSNMNENFTRPAYRHMMRKSTTKSGIALGSHIKICRSSQYRKILRDWYSNSNSGRLLMCTLLSGCIQNLHNVPDIFNQNVTDALCAEVSNYWTRIQFGLQHYEIFLIYNCFRTGVYIL